MGAESFTCSVNLDLASTICFFALAVIAALGIINPNDVAMAFVVDVVDLKVHLK